MYGAVLPRQPEHASDYVEAKACDLWEQRWPIRYLGWDLDARSARPDLPLRPPEYAPCG